MSNKISFFLRLLPAVILLQTLFFKFTAAPESVYIFSTLHAEPYGRIGTGILELIAAGLLLTPRFSFWGALLTIGLMLGAIASHILFLGIAVQNDGGKLFALAICALLPAIYVAWQERNVLIKGLPFIIA